MNIPYTRRTCLCALSGLVLLLGQQASATLTLPLTGNVEVNGWAGLNNTNYTNPTYPTTQAGPDPFAQLTDTWQAPVMANSPANGATFNKIPGTAGLFASTTMYTHGPTGGPPPAPGVFTLADASTVSGLETVVVQFEMVGSLFSAPTLDYNEGSQGLSPTFSQTLAGETTTSFGDTTILSYQWDLTGVNDINNFNVGFTVAPFGAIYEMQIDAGDTFTQVIPEPTVFVLIAGLGALGFVIFRRIRGEQ